MSVTPEEVDRIARLACLTFSDQELARLTDELNRILHHVDQLRRAPEKTSTESAEGVERGGGTRTSETPGPDPLETSPESMAPEWSDGFFVVPQPGDLRPRRQE